MSCLTTAKWKLQNGFPCQNMKEQHDHLLTVGQLLGNPSNVTTPRHQIIFPNNKKGCSIYLRKHVLFNEVSCLTHFCFRWEFWDPYIRGLFFPGYNQITEQSEQKHICAFLYGATMYTRIPLFRTSNVHISHVFFCHSQRAWSNSKVFNKALAWLPGETLPQILGV